MNASKAIYALTWLIRDTLRQALASRIFWVMMSINALCILFCLSIGIRGGDNLRPDNDFLYHGDELMKGPSLEAGRFEFLFGAFKVSLARDREEGVRFLQILLGTWASGSLGLLLALTWTAGFLPEFLQPNNVSVLLAKPAPRWLLLLGKYLGVVAFVALTAFVFFGGTWLALGIKTGVWLPAYLMGIPILIAHFASVFSFSMLLGVLTRSTVACVLGSIVFWILCFATNYGRFAAIALPQIAPETPPLTGVTMFLIDASYWVLPKPADFMLLLEHSLDSANHVATLASVPEFRYAWQTGKIHFAGSILSSLGFAAVMLFVSARQLAETDY